MSITVEEMKQKLRISHSSLDDDIEDNINVCALDLQRMGVSPLLDNALTDKAKELYCKWQFDFNGKGDTFEKAYTNLAHALALLGVDEDVGNE